LASAESQASSGVRGVALERIFGGADVLATANAILYPGVGTMPGVQPGNVAVEAVGGEQVIPPAGDCAGRGVGDSVELELNGHPGQRGGRDVT
jgi:hypothetical protein